MQSWALFILSSIPFLINLYSEKYRRDDLDKTMVELEKDLNLPRIRVYDFIVVGGGAGGCVVASRLSWAGFSVLLLEAGGTPVPATVVPMFHNDIAYSPDINYVYKSVPQKNAGLENNGVLTRRLGKMLGGSTSHYDMNYNRGHPLDFDNWAKISRDPSWKYENVLKYFIRAEDYAGPPRNYTLAALSNQHGRGGPMAVEYEETPYLPYWLQAGREMGYTVADPNGPQRESITPAALNRKNGKRVSAYTAYIEPIEASRRTLKIHRYSNVTQVLFDNNKKAYGVTYFRHGFPQIAHASKEIIVAGGAFGTPLLLLKSGVGPKEVLDAAQIPQIMDLPVGQNLQDHPEITVRVTVNDTKVFPNIWDILRPSSVQDFFESGQGHLTNYLGFPQLFKVSSLAKARDENNWPDIKIGLLSGFFNDPPVNNNTREIGFWITLARPKSIGFLSLNSTAWLNGERNDVNLAVFDYKLLSEPIDVDVLIEGIKTSLEFVENTKTFKNLGAKLVETPLPACAQHTFRSDDYWRCYIAQKSISLYHTVGTCRMGHGDGDKDAVVDSKLSVIGVSNLRVVDASVIPVIPNANTAAPVIMIAEKISAQILNDWVSHRPYKSQVTNEENVQSETTDNTLIDV